MNELVSILSGVTSIVIGFLYVKQTRRLKTAEAFEREVSALRQTVELLREEVAFDKTRIADLQGEITELLTNRNGISRKYYDAKRAAMNCPHIELSTECPAFAEMPKVDAGKTPKT